MALCVAHLFLVPVVTAVVQNIESISRKHKQGHDGDDEIGAEKTQSAADLGDGCGIVKQRVANAARGSRDRRKRSTAKRTVH